MTNDPSIVYIEVFVEFGLKEATSVVEVDRAFWNILTQKERDDFCVQAAVDYRNDVAPCGSRLLPPDNEDDDG